MKQNMETSVQVVKLFGKSEVHDKDGQCFASQAHHDVLGLNITMDKASWVNILKAGDLLNVMNPRMKNGKNVKYQLVGKEDYSTEVEFLVLAHYLMQRGTEEVEN